MKKGKVTKFREICGLTNEPIPPPYDIERYCEHYIEKNCGCSCCAVDQTVEVETPIGTQVDR